MFKLLIVSPWYFGISGELTREEVEETLKYKRYNIYEYIIYEG